MKYLLSRVYSRSIKMKRVRFIFFLPLCLILQACSGLVPSGFPVASAIQPTTTPLNETVVFVGDSITAIWGEQADFTAHNNWINKGISGETSTQLADRYQRDVVDLHPGTVHIVIGTNDVSPGWKLCDPFARDRATATTPPGPAALKSLPETCSNILYMLETAKRNKIKVVIGTIPPWGCSDRPKCGLSISDVSQKRYDRIAQLNSWIKTFAVEEGVTLVDYHTALTNAEGLHYAAGLTLDGIHPVAAGYALMQPLVESALDQ
ncbi:GDSL-type esterase/lipase family protein [Tunturiibacter gelidiferens]|uniref:GDSL-type esterase/lipase family protein n=1 Tax=Tunturiibacter gelidiferens TaxID=3069689 RepID=UPI003D9BC041